MRSLTQNDALTTEACVDTSREKQRKPNKSPAQEIGAQAQEQASPQ